MYDNLVLNSIIKLLMMNSKQVLVLVLLMVLSSGLSKVLDKGFDDSDLIEMEDGVVVTGFVGDNSMGSTQYNTDKKKKKKPKKKPTPSSNGKQSCEDQCISRCTTSPSPNGQESCEEQCVYYAVGSPEFQKCRCQKG